MPYDDVSFGAKKIVEFAATTNLSTAVSLIEPVFLSGVGTKRRPSGQVFFGTNGENRETPHRLSAKPSHAHFAASRVICSPPGSNFPSGRS